MKIFLKIKYEEIAQNSFSLNYVEKKAVGPDSDNFVISIEIAEFFYFKNVSSLINPTYRYPLWYRIDFIQCFF